MQSNTSPSLEQEFVFGSRSINAFQVDEERKRTEKLDYMHLNPVRAGLVARAVDWPWSSAR